MSDTKAKSFRYRNKSPNPAGLVVAGTFFAHGGEADISADTAQHPLHSAAIMRAQMLGFIEPVA